jgi:hypothetical protein
VCGVWPEVFGVFLSTVVHVSLTVSVSGSLELGSVVLGARIRNIMASGSRALTAACVLLSGLGVMAQTLHPTSVGERHFYFFSTP